MFQNPSAPPTLKGPDEPVGDSLRVVVAKGPNALKWYKDYESNVKAQPVSGGGWSGRELAR